MLIFWVFFKKTSICFHLSQFITPLKGYLELIYKILQYIHGTNVDLYIILGFFCDIW